MPIVYALTHEEKASIAEDILNTRGGITVDWSKGKRKWKTHNQDKTENMWHREAAEQLKDETPEEKRGYCKLHFGVPIMRGENDKFREDYDIMIRPLPYEWKLKMMMIPLDFPVTRKMTSGQKARYMSDVQMHYRSLGVVLTEPDDNGGGWQ